METVTVELRDSNAMRILKGLEFANIIRVLDKTVSGKSEITKDKKISATLRGSLSKDRANELLEQLTEMRNEWEARII
ncbi:MAG TPA: hypothetical protein VFC92_00050 [Bacteroidales bacterium]|nr:hypothetical protein [Bacteroidales bacterium]